MTFRPSGLRFQIIASLALLITLLSGLVGFAVMSISTTAIIKERRAALRLMQLSAAKSMVSAILFDSPPEVSRDIAESWLTTGNIDGIWILDGSGNAKSRYVSGAFDKVTPSARFPQTEIYEDVKTRGLVGAGKGRRHIFTQFPAGRGLGCVIVGTHGGSLAGSPTYLGTLLVTYLLLHGVAILAFGYFSLTYLIIRPVEKLKYQAVRLGEGKFNIDVEKEGAKEIQDASSALAAAASRLQSQRDELVEKIEQLEMARIEILKSQETILRSQKLASVGRLTAGVAHEIGNPLTAITGFIDVLKDESLAKEQREDFLERMRKETERMGRIIKDLLTYARADGQQISPMQVKDIIGNVCDIMKPQMLFKKIRLELKIKDDVSPVMANSDRLTQVLVNLLLNAAEAMVGEGEITVGLGESEDGKMVELVVEDNGPGISPDVLDDVFEPFVTTKPEGQGIGLGLSVCQGIIRTYGGIIRAENRPGTGARFVVRIPAARGKRKKGNAS
ncbi:MAG: ATP-binding protein [Pseudomonadota bacterium]